MKNSMETVTLSAAGSENGVLLSTDKLVKEYRGRRVVNRVSIYVGAGEIVGLLGPNGAGKTTTFNMVVGVVRPDEGSVNFTGHDVTRMAMHRRARLGVGLGVSKAFGLARTRGLPTSRGSGEQITLPAPNAHGNPP